MTKGGGRGADGGGGGEGFRGTRFVLFPAAAAGEGPGREHSGNF